MNNDWRTENAVNQMRILRHDFMNYLQVIYGYIQINRPQAAIDYIKWVNQRMLIISKIFNLESTEFALVLQDLLFYLYKYNFNIEFDTNLEYISFDNMLKNIDSIQMAFNKIKHLVLEHLNVNEYKENLLFINITGVPENFYLLITNVMELKNSTDEQNSRIELIEETNEFLLKLIKKDKGSLISLNIF